MPGLNRTNSNKTIGILLALISSSLFGIIPFFSIPLMHKGIGMPTILFYRFLFSAVVMGAICLTTKRNIRISRRVFVNLSILSILFASTSLLLIASYSYIPSGIATTIHYLYPIFVAVVMMLFYNENKSFSIITFSLTAITGIGLLCWTGGKLDILGVSFALFSIATYGIYMVGTKKFYLSNIDPPAITFYVLLLGAIIFLLLALFTTGIEPIDDIESWLYLAILAIFPTVIADLLLVYAINKFIGPTVSSILGVMEPVVAFIIGILFLFEPFSVRSILGLTIVLFSIVMVIIVTAQRKEE